MRFLLCEILLELRSGLRRIQFRHTNTRDLQVVDFGLALEELPTGRLVPCSRTQQCIVDKVSFEERFRWATTQLDSLLFVEAWKMGARWGMNTKRISDMDTRKNPEM
jgi:hypothetical protein